MRPLRSPHNPIHIALGLVIWSLWFVALYGGLSVACRVAPPALSLGMWNWLSLLLGLFSAATVALLLGLARWSWRAASRAGKPSPERFAARLAAAVHLVGAVATLVVAVPLLRLPPCV